MRSSQFQASQLQGSFVALVTPFDGQGQLDFAALERLLTRQLDAGTHGIVVAGTTGEGAALDDAEFARLLDRVVGEVGGQVPVLAGVGAAATARGLQLASLAEAGRADALLCVTPYYLRTSQAGLEAHYRALTQHVTVPLVLYNVPSRTGTDLLPQTVGRLSRQSRVVGLKEAVAGGQRVTELLECCEDGFAIVSGDDPSCLEAMRAGATGVISITANVAPGAMARMTGMARSGDWDSARALDETLAQLHRALVVEPNPIPVKWALSELGLCSAQWRLPLVPPGESTKMTLKQQLHQLASQIEA